jgi:hypothetical protein
MLYPGTFSDKLILLSTTSGVMARMLASSVVPLL